MTKVLRIASEDGADYYDLINGPLIALADGYYENVTRSDMLERRYLLYAPLGNCRDENGEPDRLIAMEAYKRIETFQRRAANYKSSPQRTQSIWLEEAAEREVPFRRSLIDSISLRMVTRARISNSLLSEGYFLAEVAFVTTPFHESSAISKLSFPSVGILGGTLEFGGGGTVDGRVERLALAPGFGRYVYNAWVGIRAVNRGTADFNPLLPFANNLPPFAWINKIPDANASIGEAVQINHSTLPPGFSMQLLNSPIFTYPGINVSHYYGRYRLLVRYKVTSLAFADTLIAMRGYYGHGVSLVTGANRGVPMETVYLQGTDSAYRFIDLGEVVFPQYELSGNDYLKEVGNTGVGIGIATEFITGNSSTDLLVLDCAILVPSESFANSVGFASPFTKVNFLNTEKDDGYIIGNTGVPIEGENRLSCPSEGGILVIVVDDSASQSPSLTVGVDFVRRFRYGRFAGNG